LSTSTRRKHFTRVAPLDIDLWLATCDCGLWQMEVEGWKGDAIERCREHQAVAEYRERVSA
jgi:hypothetical protein